MQETEKCGCGGRSERAAFDAKLAYERLSKKLAEVADVVTNYISQAGLERGARSQNAERMVKVLERIVGGKPVKPGGFPECCVIGQRFANETINWFCTGVLVHPRVVLTAAHCHDSPQMSSNIVVGLNAEDIDNLGNAEIVRVRRIKIHPRYRPNGPNDIAVLILRENANTTPVPIADADDLIDAVRTRLVGFGNDNVESTRGFGIKREVEVSITNLRRSDDDDFDEAEVELGFESDLEFTAGGEGFDSCNGDSGGPAYILVGGGRKVAGLTSRGFMTSTTPCGEGGTYTRIDVNMAFVREVAGAAGIDLS